MCELAKMQHLFKLKQSSLYCEAGHAVRKFCATQATKDKNVSKWSLVDLTWNAIVHQDSKTNHEWDSNRIALLSASYAIHYATESFRNRPVKISYYLWSQTKFSVFWDRSSNKQIMRKLGG